MKISRAAVVCGTLCAALTVPSSFAGGKKDGSFTWNALNKTLPNCSWSCGDGRTGLAEVQSEAQCAAACAGACGTVCSPKE